MTIKLGDVCSRTSAKGTTERWLGVMRKQERKAANRSYELEIGKPTQKIRDTLRRYTLRIKSAIRKYKRGEYTTLRQYWDKIVDLKAGFGLEELYVR
tara:strand:- start:398 stop:688 length:291 start_codon:yes stop_codon:yes gene_type:complete